MQIDRTNEVTQTNDRLNIGETTLSCRKHQSIDYQLLNDSLQQSTNKHKVYVCSLARLSSELRQFYT